MGPDPLVRAFSFRSPQSCLVTLPAGMTPEPAGKRGNMNPSLFTTGP